MKNIKSFITGLLIAACAIFVRAADSIGHPPTVAMSNADTFATDSNVGTHPATRPVTVDTAITNSEAKRHLLYKQGTS